VRRAPWPPRGYRVRQARGRRGRRVPGPVAAARPLRYRVTAPSEALETSLAYFESTPGSTASRGDR